MKLYYRQGTNVPDQGRTRRQGYGLISLLTLALGLALATPCLAIEKTTPTNGAVEPAGSAAAPAPYKWNSNDAQRPLLSLGDQVRPDIAQSLTYPLGQFAFPLLQALEHSERSGRYSLRLVPRSGNGSYVVELQQSGPSGNGANYVSTDGSNLRLLVNKGLTTIRANDATEYTFVRFSDGTDRCIRVKTSGGPIISLVYTRDNLIHCVIDSEGRTIKFNYEERRLVSITQTWTVDSVSVNRDWVIRKDSEQTQYAHVRPIVPRASASTSTPTKSVPRNALTQKYTDTMARNDRVLAGIFGGTNAVAAANGFEPRALAEQYPLYRGDFTADDGRVLRGHLSFAMHLYGNANGTGDSPLYVPAGFTSHSNIPTPTDAVITFYYPRLGNLTNVTLAVFHVANFQITYEGARVRIGNIGGPGGDTICYKHSHLEFYRGDTGLPTAAARTNLRIDPATVFGKTDPVPSSSKTIHRSADCADCTD